MTIHTSTLRIRWRFTFLACTTTPCPTASWPLVTWKGSGAHVSLSVQAKPLEPLLSIPDAMKNLLLLCRLEDEDP
ncbi:unnamed protein product [Spirodela intermedia]|uniref:Uncharacterized protein n=1 Tax=Spirodela intermedia TaxID=51605 RepID=A0A7I8KF43_SPIIN|nr:unnamed protein product [Spirodela intermedia]